MLKTGIAVAVEECGNSVVNWVNLTSVDSTLVVTSSPSSLMTPSISYILFRFELHL
jgi:hypothetical protein